MVRDFRLPQFAMTSLMPRVLESFRNEEYDASIFREMASGSAGATIPEQLRRKRPELCVLRT